MRNREPTRIRRELISFIVIAVCSLLFYALLRRSPGSQNGSRFLEASIVAMCVVYLTRVVWSTRRRIRRVPPSSLDSVGLQPGELAGSKATKPDTERLPPRLLKIEGMIRAAATDPDYFKAKLKPVLDEVMPEIRSEEIVLEPVRDLRWLPDRWSRARRKNIKRMYEAIRWK